MVAGLKWDDSSSRPDRFNSGCVLRGTVPSGPTISQPRCVRDGGSAETWAGGEVWSRIFKTRRGAHDCRLFRTLVLYASPFWISYIATFPPSLPPYLYSPSGSQNKRPNVATTPAKNSNSNPSHHSPAARNPSHSLSPCSPTSPCFSPTPITARPRRRGTSPATRCSCTGPRAAAPTAAAPSA